MSKSFYIRNNYKFGLENKADFQDNNKLIERVIEEIESKNGFPSLFTNDITISTKDVYFKFPMLRKQKAGLPKIDRATKIVKKQKRKIVFDVTERTLNLEIVDRFSNSILRDISISIESELAKIKNKVHFSTTRHTQTTDLMRRAKFEFINSISREEDILMANKGYSFVLDEIFMKSIFNRKELKITERKYLFNGIFDNEKYIQTFTQTKFIEEKLKYRYFYLVHDQTFGLAIEINDLHYNKNLVKGVNECVIEYSISCAHLDNSHSFKVSFEYEIENMKPQEKTPLTLDEKSIEKTNVTYAFFKTSGAIKDAKLFSNISVDFVNSALARTERYLNDYFDGKIINVLNGLGPKSILPEAEKDIIKKFICLLANHEIEKVLKGNVGTQIGDFKRDFDYSREYTYFLENNIESIINKH